jgi:hypothetical protein
MARSSFASLDTQAAKITAALEDGVLRVVMSGTVDAREPGDLFDPYWRDLDEAVRREGVTTVELDLSGLEYMNSSGILTLVRWMLRVKAQPAYHIVVHHDRSLTWQKTNVPVLAKLAPAVVRMATP